MKTGVDEMMTQEEMDKLTGDLHRFVQSNAQLGLDLTESFIEQRKLEAKADRLLAAGRYITMALGGAASDDEDCWTPEEVQKLFEHVCLRWPEFDPRKPDLTDSGDERGE